MSGEKVLAKSMIMSWIYDLMSSVMMGGCMAGNTALLLSDEIHDNDHRKHVDLEYRK